MSEVNKPLFIIEIWRNLPLSLLHALGYVIGSILFIISFLFVAKRKKIFYVIKKCNFHNPNFIVFRYLQILACAVLDYPYWWLNDDKKLKEKIIFDDREGILNKYNDCPIIFVGGHLASTEVIVRLLGFYRFPIYFVYQGSKNKYVQPIHKIRGTLPKFVPISSKNPAQFRILARSLKTNGTLVIYPDMPSPRASSLKIKFFNHSTWMMGLPVRLKELAAKNIKIVYFETIHNFGKYCITLTDITSKIGSNNRVANMQVINDYIENSIKKHPDQYLWFSNKFKE